MRINRLAIQNFKSIASLTIDTGGHDIEISGRNGAGKSSVGDAIMWCLNGRDLRGQAIKSGNKPGFDIRPLTAKPEDNTFVELTFDNRLILSRFYEAKQVKNRGVDEWQYSETYAVDGVGCRTKQEYDDVVARLYPVLTLDGKKVETLRLLCDPAYFAGLDWDVRRSILLHVFGGDITDDAVIASDERLKGLRELMKKPNGVGTYTVAEVRKRADDERKRLAGEMAGLPAVIAELRRGME